MTAPTAGSGPETRARRRATRLAIALVVVAGACSSGPRGSAVPLSHITPVPISAGFDRVTAPVLPSLESYTLGGDARAVFVTGSRINGDRGVNPAFVYDIARHELARVESAPFSPAVDAPQAMTVGHHVIVTGISCRDVGDRFDDPPIRDCRPGTLVAARFDLDARRWTRLPSPAAAVSGSVNAYLRPLGAIGNVAVFHTPDRVVTFDDRTQRWSSSPLPTAPKFPTVCMQGEGSLIAYSPVPRPDDRFGGVTSMGASIWSLPPGTPTWTPVALPAVQFFDEATAHRANDFQVVCGARGFVLTDGILDRVYFHDATTSQWRDIRPPGGPVTIGEAPHISAPLSIDTVLTIGDRFFFSGPRAVVYDAARGAWAGFVPGAGHPFGQDELGRDVVIGGALYTTWAGAPDEVVLAAFRPVLTPLPTTG